MRTALLAVLALALAQPAASQDGGVYEQAVAARQRGEPAEAVRLLEPLVAQNPGHADAHVQLGYARLALGRLDEAASAFRAALAVAPGYADARIGLARVAQRQGDRAGALREIAPLDPALPEVQALREQLERGDLDWRWAFDADVGYATVDGTQPDWKDGALQVRHRVNERTALSARGEFARRFGRSDLYLQGSLDRAIGTRGRAYFLLGATPDADFRPEWQVGAGGSYRLTDGNAATVLTLDLRHAEFVTGDVQTVTPGLEQYLLGGRAWLTGRWINTLVDGDHLTGFLVRGDFQAHEDLRLFAGYSDAPDTSEGVVVDTRSYFGGISVDLGDGLTGRVSAAFEDSETGADRTQVGFGIGRRF